MEIKHISGTKGFMASDTGVIFDASGNIKNQYENGDKYQTASVLLDNGKWQTFGVHRLVAIAHIPYYGKLEDLTVNHIDGNIKNNIKSNLEWVSVADNNIHAILLRGSKNRPVILAKNVNGEYRYIPNLKDAAEIFNCDIDLIWNIVKDGKQINGWILSHHGSKSIIPKELHKKTYLELNNPRKIKVLNLDSGEMLYFNSLWECSSKFNTTSSHVFSCISFNNRKRLFQQKYLIVDIDSEFPTISTEEYEYLKSSLGKSVITYNSATDNIVIYKSASQFIKENNLSKKAVTVDLKNNRLRQLNDWWYLYLNDKNIELLKTIIKRPGLVIV